eukprot:gene2263-biopygen3455
MEQKEDKGDRQEEDSLKYEQRMRRKEVSHNNPLLCVVVRGETDMFLVGGTTQKDAVCGGFHGGASAGMALSGYLSNFP